MKDLFSKLDGHKTHLAAVFAVVLVILKAFSVITPDQFEALISLAAAFGFYGLRDAVRKLENESR